MEKEKGVDMEISKKKGLIFNIQRYSLNDGSGIRTIVFFKGCPLRCPWCSNPESQKMEIEEIRRGEGGIIKKEGVEGEEGGNKINGKIRKGKEGKMKRMIKI